MKEAPDFWIVALADGGCVMVIFQEIIAEADW